MCFTNIFRFGNNNAKWNYFKKIMQQEQDLVFGYLFFEFGLARVLFGLMNLVFTETDILFH